LTGTLFTILVLVYLLGLFAIARKADKATTTEAPARRAAIYGLSLAVSIGTWIYFTSTLSATRYGWNYLAGGAGSLLAVTLFFPVLFRVAAIVKRENIVSIADFLSSRYGKSRSVGTIAAILSLVASVPFIALQLKSASTGWATLTHGTNSDAQILFFAVMLAGLSILFGARKATLTEQNRGLVRIIAVESVFKFVMLLLVALLGLAIIVELLHSNRTPINLSRLVEPLRLDGGFFNSAILAFATLLCAPRQFYITFVEMEKTEDLKKGRWLYICYLVAAYALVLPIAIAGATMFGPQGADMYVLRLPQQFGGEFFSVLVFLGAFSCIASLVMLEAVALSSMISNELIMPLLVRTKWYSNPAVNIAAVLVNTRRIAICSLFLLGWLYFHSMRPEASTGLFFVTASCVAQFLPAMLGGLFWRRGHASGAIAGMCAGFAVWLYALAAPQFMDNFGVLYDLGLRLAVDSGTDRFVQKVLLSLAVNTLFYVGVSLAARAKLVDRIQASAFIDVHMHDRNARRNPDLQGTVADLKKLVAKFVGHEAAGAAFAELERQIRHPIRDKDRVTPALARSAERMLASAVGSSLARNAIGWQLSQGDWTATDVLDVLDDTVQFNRELLQATLDHMSQAVYVVDRNGKLEAWNSRYIELFNFPPGFIHVGRDVGDAIRLSLTRSGLNAEEVEARVNMRLMKIRQGVSYDAERTSLDGTVLKILGSPMPGGRYVTSFTDVTELRRGARALQLANEQLEERVDTRTRELTIANSELAQAKSRAERATNAQARFLAAASHDLLQPLHAARLFMGALREGLPQEGASLREMANNADLSIETANRLLRALLNLSRLEVGGVKLETRPVDINALLTELRREFEPIATDKGITLRVVPSNSWVMSNPDLLRSVLQNLIGNAVRYTRTGAVLVGCRREGNDVRFEVRDSGPGIPENALGIIFEEFYRLPGSVDTGPGAGLGLAIADRICKLLNHRLGVRSELGKGSTFSVCAPRTQLRPFEVDVLAPGLLPVGLKVLCVENDTAILQGMEALLLRWGAQVSTATSARQAMSLPGSWDVILADYHLEDDGNGLDLIEAMTSRANIFALITADESEDTLARAARLGVEVIRKPVAPAWLRIFLSRALRGKAAAE
jgi:signal transduction histidine kinase/Na+/proline symporter